MTDQPEVMQVTHENMNRIAAMIRFDVEAKLGHLIPDGMIYATVRNGEPLVVVDEKYRSALD